MAINMGYPNAGITSVTGQQGNPMGGVQQPVNTNQFNPQESIEDTIIRLYQTNVPIDQIAQMTGTDPAMVAQVINNSTGADTMSNMRPPPAPGGPQMDMPQETFNPNLSSGPPPRPKGVGTQALVAINPGYARENPDAVGEAEKVDAQIQRATRDVFGIGVENPDLVQELNAVELSVLEDFESEGDGQSSGVSGAVQENALLKIGLNDIFTNADIGLEDRIDFFKHYIAETMGLPYDNLKEAPDQGMPYLAAASALLNASKSGDSRMSGIGQALVSFGTTKRQIERVNNKDAQNLLMTSFNLGLESLKIAQSGAKGGVGNIGQYIVPSISSEPILMGDKEAMGYQRSGLNLQKYSETKENPKQYAIPTYNADKSGVVYEYKEMTPTQAAAKADTLDSDLLAAGYTVNAVDQTNARTMGFIKSPDGDVEQISMQEYLTLPTSDPRKEYEFMKAGDTQSVFDLEEGIARIVPKSEVLKNPMTTLPNGQTVERYVPNTMMKTTTINPDGTVTMMEGAAGSVKGYAGSRAQLGEIRETREKLINLDLGTRKVLDNVDLIKTIAKEGLFGGPAGFLSSTGNYIASTREAYKVYRKDLVENGRAIKGQSYDTLYNNFADKYEQEIMNYAWAPKLEAMGIQKDRITAAMFGLAISSAKLLAEQKGRDISNADIERFMQEIGANASSLLGFQSIVNDLEYKILRNYQRQAGPDGIYRDTQVMIDNPKGADLPQVGSLSVGNQYFAPGGRGEKTQKYIDERLKALGIDNDKRSVASAGVDAFVPPPDTYSSFSRKLKQDKSGTGAKIAQVESTGETISWNKLAKQIIYDEVHGDPATSQQITIQRIKDAFPDTPAGREDMEEFMKWYTSF
jgi:hypothetical protein